MKALIIFEGKVIDKLPILELNEFGRKLQFHIINEDTSAVNLTNYTMKLVAKKLNDFNEYLIDDAGVITDLTAGYCEFTFSQIDLNETGSFLCSIELVKIEIVHSVSTITARVVIPLGYLEIQDDADV